MRPAFRLLVISSLIAGVPNLAVGQSCKAPSDTSSLLVNSLKVAFANVDSAFVTSQGQPFAQPSDIALVTDSLTCAAGIAAYNQENGTAISSAWVIQIGTSGYAVVSPTNQVGEFKPYYLFNTSWQLKVVWAG